VIQGHSHNYQRSYPLIFNEERYSDVEIKGKSLSVEYYSDTNDTIDKFMITKNPPYSNVDEKNEVQGIGYDEPTK
jgi:hypothetical protein